MSPLTGHQHAKPPGHALAALLLVLAGLYGWWFGSVADWPALVVFAVPPLLMAAGALRDSRQARFWAGVFALGWFSHGIMVAWSRPQERWLALLETVLAVAIIIVANLPGLRGKFGRKRR